MVANSHVKAKEFRRLMLKTGELTTDVGSVVYGKDAVDIGLIDSLGSLSDALDCLHAMIDAEKKGEETRHAAHHCADGSNLSN